MVINVLKLLRCFVGNIWYKVNFLMNGPSD